MTHGESHSLITTNGNKRGAISGGEQGGAAKSDRKKKRKRSTRKHVFLHTGSFKGGNSTHSGTRSKKTDSLVGNEEEWESRGSGYSEIWRKKSGKELGRRKEGAGKGKLNFS